MRMLFLLPLLFLAGCGAPDRSPELVLPAFWTEVSRWIETGEDSEAACRFLDQRLLEVYRETENPCQSALELSFPRGDITKVEPLGKSQKIASQAGEVWLQPVLLHSSRGVVRRESAAGLLRQKNWAIQSLDGLRFQTLAENAAPSAAELALLRSR